MPPDLELLPGARWRGQEIKGRRPIALLAALTVHREGLSDDRLIEEIWSEDLPGNPEKALQVLVSRVRAQCAGGAVERREGRYRLALSEEQVDALLLERSVGTSEWLLAAGRAQDAADEAGHGLALIEAATDPSAATGPRREVLRAAHSHLSTLRRVRGRALRVLGRPGEAYLLLLAAHDADPDHAPTLVDLLRAEAASSGAPAALARYAAYRADLADRLGIDPPQSVQQVHRELLAADSPIRSGLRYDTPELLGRRHDLARLAAALEDSRLVTVLGPGGIGKTSIAQVLAQSSPLPRVDVVGLVGVTSDDVVAELGARLGVRETLASRSLTPAQQTDVRGRIAEELDSVPTLLVLDNCEHVLETVATLTAFLLASTRDLRILATSRAPLRVAAERAVVLTQLQGADAARLFVDRGRAARPEARFEPQAVAEVVERLDGLPLAVELAAARVRTMSVAQIRDRLDDRLTLLRTRDRGAPSRHRTLRAVIVWSWDLLAPGEQHALTWLSTFQDGFTADTASSLLGEHGPDLVETLVDQSLLVVDESAGSVRFRMLETIREFALAELRAAGALEEALADRDRWAAELVSRHGSVLVAPDQVAAIDGLLAEENNLTDVLRRALSRGAGDLVIRLMESLGSLWAVTGNHPRLYAVADDIEALLVGWDPAPELRESELDVVAILLLHLSWMSGRDLEGLQSVLTRWGEPRRPWPLAAYVMHAEQHDEESLAARLVGLVGEQTAPEERATLLMWSGMLAEHGGDVAMAERRTLQALEHGPLSPYLEASMHAQLASLAMSRGDYHEGGRHARRAEPLLRRVHALDDARAMQICLVAEAIGLGDLPRASELLDAVEREAGIQLQLGARMLIPSARAELALAAGRLEEAVRGYDAVVDDLAQSDGPGSGSLPWILFAATGCLVARARFLAPAEPERAAHLRDLLVHQMSLPEPAELRHADLSIHGLQLVGVASWALGYAPAGTHDDALRLLAIAKTWFYNATLPSLGWSTFVELAERVRPGRLDEHLAELAGRPGRSLRDDAERLVRRVTSCG